MRRTDWIRTWITLAFLVFVTWSVTQGLGQDRGRPETPQETIQRLENRRGHMSPAQNREYQEAQRKLFPKNQGKPDVQQAAQVPGYTMTKVDVKGPWAEQRFMVFELTRNGAGSVLFLRDLKTGQMLQIDKR